MGTRITVYVKPGASRTRVGGRHGDALVVAVSAPASEGRATEAVLGAVADALGVRRRQVQLAKGATSRTKQLEIDADPTHVATQVSALLEA